MLMSGEEGRPEGGTEPCMLEGWQRGFVEGSSGQRSREAGLWRVAGCCQRWGQLEGWHGGVFKGTRCCWVENGLYSREGEERVARAAGKSLRWLSRARGRDADTQRAEKWSDSECFA